MSLDNLPHSTTGTSPPQRTINSEISVSRSQTRHMGPCKAQHGWPYSKPTHSSVLSATLHRAPDLSGLWSRPEDHTPGLS